MAMPDIDGELRAGVFAPDSRERLRLRPRSPLVMIRNRWHEFRFSNRSIAQAKANARFHYGLGEAVLSASGSTASA